MASERFSLLGRHALVTGAARGIGRGIAEAFIDAGAHVVRADRVSGADIYACDVTQAAEVEELFREAGPIDILVCAAGVTSAMTVSEATVGSLSRALCVNVTGTFLCCKAAMQQLRNEGRSGRIILVGSVVGHQGALKGHVTYAASKGAVHTMAKTLARTNAPLGVTVTSSRPVWSAPRCRSRRTAPLELRRWPRPCPRAACRRSAILRMPASTSLPTRVRASQE